MTLVLETEVKLTRGRNGGTVDGEDEHEMKPKETL